MSYRVTVKYTAVVEALEPLLGLRLLGSIQGPPLSKLPLRRIVDNAMRQQVIGREEYRGTIVVGVKVDEKLELICHFKTSEPDDFCIALEGDKPWARVTQAAHKLSKATNASYTEILAGIVHALQGIISGEEEEVEEISDADQVVEELLTWLPEYISIID